LGDIAAVIPAYNASGSVASVVRRASEHVTRVIVVDDGSTDDTADRARSSGAEVLLHPRNRGKGAALRTAFDALADSRLDAVITLDADGQHDPADIPRFVETFRDTGADLIIGSRQQAFDEMSGPRRFGNRFSSSAVAFFTGLRLSDSQSGFRLYSLPFLRSTRLRGEGYELEMEAILLASAHKKRIESVPIHLLVADGRDRSHYRAFRDTTRICACVVGFWLRRLVGSAP
jgi:glycosyltransferase involved in cell wall biosynthesis